jgi:hypothetical protein
VISSAIGRRLSRALFQSTRSRLREKTTGERVDQPRHRVVGPGPARDHVGVDPAADDDHVDLPEQLERHPVPLVAVPVVPPEPVDHPVTACHEAVERHRHEEDQPSHAATR